MAEPETTTNNIEMTDADETQASPVNGSVVESDKGENGSSQAVISASSQRTPYGTYLKSRMVEIVVGVSEVNRTVLNVHQDLIMQSPFFADRMSKLGPGDHSTVHLPDEDLASLESFPEFLYTKEYFPRLTTFRGEKVLELSDDIPTTDSTGTQLLRHARLYTMAKKFGVDELYQLAFEKVHLVESSPSAEIAYARYVYESTPLDQAQVRDPVKAYWASQAHELRHEVQDAFRKMFLDFPQFGYDVLSLVFDQKEKEKSKTLHRQTSSQRLEGSARKRLRLSETPRV